MSAELKIVFIIAVATCVTYMTVLYLRTLKRKINTLSFLDSTLSVVQQSVHIQSMAIDLGMLQKQNLMQRFSGLILRLISNIGGNPIRKIALCIMASIFVIKILTKYIFGGSFMMNLIVGIPIFIASYLIWVKSRTSMHFNESFPNALNIIASAVSAGDSLLNAITHVGKKLNDNVGAEFSIMSQKLNLGESASDVFRKAALRLPYESFQFFVIAMRVNIAHGGQLKPIIERLYTAISDAKVLDRKKYALTAEARMSAKIVCAIPFVFLFGVMKFLSPENYMFVMNDPDGKIILYYMLSSEVIGMGVIYWLLRSVQ